MDIKLEKKARRVAFSQKVSFSSFIEEAVKDRLAAVIAAAKGEGDAK